MKNYLLSLGLFSVSLICQANFSDGMTAYNAGDYQTALREWNAAAEQKPALSNDLQWHSNNTTDVIDAQYGLGILYWQGKGVTQSYLEAKKWLLLAANGGHSVAQLKLAYLHLRGLDGQINATEAVKWFEKSAQQGNMNAQYLLGLLYFNGESTIPKDKELAKKWLTAAAQQGEISAKTLLAEINGTVNKSSSKQPATAMFATPIKTKVSSSSPLSGYYAIQLLASTKKNDAAVFLEKWHNSLKPLKITHKIKNNETIFVVVYGEYVVETVAKQALSDLPEKLKKNKPWLVKMHGNELAP